MSAIGQRVREARIQRGWSQQDLADAAGVSQTTIDKIESGLTTRSKFLPEIFSVLGIHPNLLLEQSSIERIFNFSLPNPVEVGVGSAPETKRSPPLIPVYISLTDQNSDQFTIGKSPDRHILKPRQLDQNKDAYGIYISSNNMRPELDAGDIALFHTQLPVLSDMTGVFFCASKPRMGRYIGRLVGETLTHRKIKLWESGRELMLPHDDFPDAHKLFCKITKGS